MRKSKQAMLAGAAALLALAAFASPTLRADIRILAHESGDRAPQRMQAALDTGFFAVSVLVTWSKRLAR
jgi:hypothetical protein